MLVKTSANVFQLLKPAFNKDSETKNVSSFSYGFWHFILFLGVLYNTAFVNFPVTHTLIRIRPNMD
jgi:hypothetical protein